MRDVARILAEARATKFQPPAGMPTLTPVAPTATVGNVQAGTRPANKGVKRFMTGPGGEWGDMTNPAWWAKGLGEEANKQVVQPIVQMPSAFDPTADLSVAERINRAGTGALTLLDVASPFIPEGTMAKMAREEAMQRMIDRQVASYAESGGGLKYRGVLGVHGSPMPGLTQIEPRAGSQMMPDTAAAFTWRANNPEYPYDVGRMFDLGSYYATAESPLASAARKPQIYVTRAPGRAVAQEFPSDMFVSADPVNVVGSIDLAGGKRDLRRAMLDVMTPLETRKYKEAALQRQIKRGVNQRDLLNMMKEPGDF